MAREASSGPSSGKTARSLAPLRLATAPAAAAPAAPLFRPDATRLAPPRASQRAVRRDGVLAALDGVEAPLVLVSAPAGSGKTTLLRQWTESSGRPASWLRLDASDDGLATFLLDLAHAISIVAPVDPAVLESLGAPGPSAGPAVVAALTRALAEAPPFLLVLDDGDTLASPQCWRVLSLLLDAVPPGAHVAVGTRRDPPLPLARLRAAGMLAEVRFDDLAFGPAEVAQLLELNDRAADGATIDGLLDLTGGWAAGVYLAILSGDEAPGLAPGAASRSHEEVGRYLASEVLEHEPERVREFMLRTSILDPLRPGLCEQVAGSPDAWRMFEAMAAENLLVSCLEGEAGACRYHRLYASYLQDELRRRMPAEVAPLHDRAARWYEREGDVARAVGHYLAAGEARRAGYLVTASWPDYATHGRLDTLLSWLRLFSTEQILESSSLTLTSGWVHLLGGDAESAAFWLRAAAGGTDDGPYGLGSATLATSRAALRCVVGYGGVTQMNADAELATNADEQQGDGHILGVAGLALGTARYLAGRPDAEEALLAAAGTEGGYNPLRQMGALALLSLLARDRGDWDTAEARAAEARALVDELQLERQSPSATAHAAWACALARRGDPTAWEEAARAEAVVQAATVWPWRTVLVAVVLGELCADHDRTGEAATWSAAADAVLAGWPDAGILGPRTAALRARLRGRASLPQFSKAEERVLQLLSSHLSAREMAVELGVSPNTVRTHTKRIYAKLGASSRSDAVALARELGLT